MVHFEHGRKDLYWKYVDTELINWRKKANYKDVNFTL